MKSFPAFLLAAIAVAQTASSHLPGTVTSVNAASNQISIKTAQGDLTFTANERTQILRAQSGVADPKQWPKMALGEIAAGDEVVAYYRGAADQKPLVATSLVVRTKADIGQLAQKQLEDWKKRGSSGTVSAVDPVAKTLTMKAGQRTVTVQAGEKTAVRRYSPDSAKPADAKASTLAEIHAGDQVHVLGNRTEDGAKIDAEMIYAGTFRQIAAQINSIDPSTGEMKVTDLATKKPLTIVVTTDSTMKKLPEPMAQALARRYQGGRGGAPSGQGRAGGDVGQMLDRLPSIQLTELKPKDAIMVSTTMGTDPGKVTAVMLLAGVEPVLTAAPTATRDILGGWNLGGGEGGEGQ
jgi:hypothetical protein